MLSRGLKRILDKTQRVAVTQSMPNSRIAVRPAMARFFRSVATFPELARGAMGVPTVLPNQTDFKGTDASFDREGMSVLEDPTHRASDAFYSKLLSLLFGGAVAATLLSTTLEDGVTFFDQPLLVMKHCLDEKATKPAHAMYSQIEGVDQRALFTVGPIILINCLVYLYTMRNESALSKYAVSLHNVVSKKRWQTLITNTWCHAGPLHLGINMFCLWSFGSLLSHQWSPEFFWTTYFLGGIAASVLGLLIGAGMFKLGGLLKRANPNFLTPGVGASSIICALVVYVAMTYPQLQFGLLFLPGHLGAKEAISLLALFDVLGLLWIFSGRTSPIGHNMHIGGYIVGYLLYKFVQKMKKNSGAQRTGGRISRPAY